MMSPIESGRMRSGPRGISRVLLVVLLTAYSAAALTLWVDNAWRPGWDGGIYLLAARSIAEGQGYSYLGKPFFLRPPGLSWLLSHFVKDGEFNFPMINIFIRACAAATVWAVFLVLRKRCGAWRAFGIALLLGTCPLFVSILNLVLSDFAFMMLLFPGLGLLDWAARGRRPNPAGMVAGGLLIAGSAYMRTAALVVVPGIALVYLLKLRGRQRLLAILPVIVILASIAPWLAWSRRAKAEAERPADQLMLFDYETAVLRVDTGDPDSQFVTPSMWWDRIKGNLRSLMENVSIGILGTANKWAGYGLAAVVILGFLLCLSRGISLLEWFALSYTAVLLSYFTLTGRLLIPLLPLIYAYILTLLEWLTGLSGQLEPRSGRMRMIEVIVVACLLAANGRGLALGEQTALREIKAGPGVRSRRWDDYARAADWLRANTPEHVAILTGPAPMLSVLAKRRAYTYRFESVSSILAKERIDFAVFFWWNPEDVEQQIASLAADEWELNSTVPGRSIRIYKLGENVLRH
jgi:4-amino-4-deoxy-L-arabinose transferase-like glycosyltransferase